MDLESDQFSALDKEDICKLFGYFGEIDRVTILSKDSALITFKDIISAFLALQSLNQLQMPQLSAKLNIRWQLNTIRETIDFYGNKTFIEEKKMDETSHVKYTCKFDIQIENDKDFQVAKRIIGPKGANMKRILEACSKESLNGVKLRLRGKGSGFKEGLKNIESDEPLHLCISSKFHSDFITACNMVQELILGVYDDYKKYNERSGKEMNKNLKITRVENIVNKKY